MRLLIKYLRTWWRTRLPLVLPLVVVLVVVLVLVLVLVVVVLAVLAVLAVAEGSWMRQQIGTENRPCASCPRQKRSFAKTRSGQTRGKVEQRLFSLGCWSWQRVKGLMR